MFPNYFGEKMNQTNLYPITTANYAAIFVML